MKAKYVDGVVQGGVPIILDPVQWATKSDILAALDSKVEWMRTGDVRLALLKKHSRFSTPNLAARLRCMADAKEIERRYNNSRRPEYRSIKND